MMPWLGRGYVDLKTPGDKERQTRRFRMWRPWMWGPLVNFWQIHYELSAVDTLWGPSRYLWRGEYRKEQGDE